MTEVANFNVGGQAYQVSRSLLEQHPETMLSKSASEQWQSESDAEIFIERDGEMFRHVLNYLRDGKVNLPLTVTKKGFLSELEYYGIAGVDLKLVDSSAPAGEALIHANKLFNEMCASLSKGAREAESKAGIMMFAKFCIERSMTSGKSERQLEFNPVEVTEIPRIPIGKERLVNEYLMQVGLKLTKYTHNGHYADITMTVMD